MPNTQDDLLQSENDRLRAEIAQLRGQLDSNKDLSKFPTTRKEATPVRMRAKNWTETCCKRCGDKGARDGSWIVRIFGVGWWHDECYRVVNPDYYVGL